MGKNKLKKFREMETLQCVHQYPFGLLRELGGCPLRGQWDDKCFGGHKRPLVLELGCGKGEYTVGMARRRPDKNFIGIDIKGARMWTGACQVRDLGLDNAAFLRTSIELLADFFAPGEISEIWITFCDPQFKKTNKRLTSSRFMTLYRKLFGSQGGTIHLKTDSPFLWTYTQSMLRASGIEPTQAIADVHAPTEPASPLTEILTYYESQWISRGIPIKYLQWHLPASGSLLEPESEPEPDTYRSFGRGMLQMPQLLDCEE